MAAEVPPTDQPAAGRPRRSTLTLYLILLLSLAPLVSALMAYYMPSSGLRPEGHNNYGELIDPQRPTPSTQALPLQTLEGEPFDLASLRGRWVLVTADQAACPESCVRKLFILRNAHASQGKNVERLTRVWFVTDDGAVPQVVLDAYRGTHMLRADPAQLSSFLAPAVAGAPDRGEVLRAHMWVIDPLGNLMLAFPPDADPIKVRDDLTKLIRVSRVG